MANVDLQASVGPTSITLAADLVGLPVAMIQSRPRTSAAYELAKRSIDLAFGFVLCLVAVPVVVVLAAILAIQLRAWPFFVHDRVGRNGRTFRMPKLRTLPPSTPRDADKTAVALAPVSGLAAKLRRTHVDELPQLYLVLIGRLSLVGPRPRMPSEVAEMPQPSFDELRVSVPQGCTGMWQVSPAQCLRVTDSPQYDSWYIEHRTLRLDLWILWRTACQALGGEPRSLDQVPAFARSALATGGT